MSDVTKPPEDPESVESSDDPIARLIRLAGPRPPVPEERMARVRDDGRAALRLDAGPSVRLDAGSDLRLVSAHVLELRRGAVYVDTGARSPNGSAATASGAEGPASPIEIRTSLGRVRDVGTQFEVRL